MIDDIAYVRHPNQPPDDMEWQLADSVFVKQMFLAVAGMIIPQHSHKYSHHSMLAAGSIRVWQDGLLLGDFKAPQPIYIPSGTKHTFESLEANTVVYCIHNVERTGIIQVKDEHQLIGV